MKVKVILRSDLAKCRQNVISYKMRYGQNDRKLMIITTTKTMNLKIYKKNSISLFAVQQASERLV